LEHGLLRGSFVPPPAIRQLRDLTRYRKRLARKHGNVAGRNVQTGLGSYNVVDVHQSREASHQRLEGRWKMSIGVGIFLMVLGAILAFAVETDVPGINVNSLGVILLLIGLVAVLYSLLFWSNLTPWGRRRVAARRRLVGEEQPVEVIEERPLDDGLP
jgi:hypothetical protein